MGTEADICLQETGLRNLGAAAKRKQVIAIESKDSLYDWNRDMKEINELCMIGSPPQDNIFVNKDWNMHRLEQ